jgi:hypothetical protein
VEQIQDRVMQGREVHALVMQGMARVGKGPFVCL